MVNKISISIGTVHDNRVSYLDHSRNESETYHQGRAGAIYNGDVIFNGGRHDHHSGRSAGQGRARQRASVPTPNHDNFHGPVAYGHMPALNSLGAGITQEPSQFLPSDNPDPLNQRTPINNTEYGENENDYGYAEPNRRARAQPPPGYSQADSASSALPSSVNHRKQGRQQPRPHRRYTQPPPRMYDRGPLLRPSPYGNHQGRCHRTKAHSRSTTGKDPLPSHLPITMLNTESLERVGRMSTRARTERAPTIPAIQPNREEGQWSGIMPVLTSVGPVAREDLSYDELWMDLTTLQHKSHWLSTLGLGNMHNGPQVGDENWYHYRSLTLDSLRPF